MRLHNVNKFSLADRSIFIIYLPKTSVSGLFLGKDFICVASMDGMLSFFEQEMFAFGRFLPGFLLPSPVRYIAKTDSFVTCSSSRLVECYKYVQYYDSAEEFNVM